MKIIVVVIFFVFFAGAKVYCQYVLSHNRHTLKYECRRNEDLEVLYKPTEPFNGHPPISSLNVSSCASVNLTSYMGANLEHTLTSIIIKDVTNTLEFSPLLYSLHLKQIELVNIGNIPKFEGHTTFAAFDKLDHFHIENTFIDEFDQSFNMVEVKEFKLKNVMISNLRVLEFSSSNGTYLEIIDSHITVNLLKPNDSLSFEYFDKITIKNTTFDFPTGGKISMFGRKINLSNNVFFNASVNVVGREIGVFDTCADGSSVMRLHHNESGDHIHEDNKFIVSRRNKLPSEIHYVGKHTHSHNSICPNAKCGCVLKRSNSPKPGRNFADNIHQKTSSGFFFYSIIIASAIVARF